MTVPLLNTQIITYEVAIDDSDLKKRMELELLSDLGLVDSETGNPRPGVTADTRRDGGAFGKGKCLVRVTRDLSKSQDKRLPAPERDGAQ